MVIKLGRSEAPDSALSANYDWKEVESRVRRFYEEVDVKGILARKFADVRPEGWVEGPPTLNNQPHIGHVRGRMMKDLYYRYSTLSGVYVIFRGGWDTQGLPVELQAEKELGLTGNKWENLKQVGVETLVQACKDLIAKYRKVWEEADDLLGLMLDQEASYMTYRDAYIEREWKYLKVAWESQMLGEGFKVVPYCPSCQTSLSQAELALGGYELLEDPSLYYKVKASDGTFLALWTTMPFTLVTDELVAVKPDADYEYVKVGSETWVVGAERKSAFFAEAGAVFGETVKKVKGRELEGISYEHPLLGAIPGLERLRRKGKIHKVFAEEFVDTSTGTGLVHASPANGEDDFAVAQRWQLPVFAPFDDQVRFTSEAGEFAGMFARDSDAVVLEKLRGAGALVHYGRIEHEYPVCWRSGHRLVWLARREYFYWVERIRESLVEAAEGVEYYFEAPKNRFIEFLRESPPWCITRERIWGTPLPVWACGSCGQKTAVFSRKEIIERAVELPDGENFELHRPWVDRIILRCGKCGSNAVREPFVLDTWHNSGSAPYSSQTDEEYERLVPARFLTEGIDQTRGWAYTLLVLNVIMSKKPIAPYKAFLFQGHVLDEKGRKMSKSLGNTIQGLDLLRDNSVDLSRFYLTWKSSPEDSLSLDMAEMSARPYQVLNTLYHLHVYLLQNGALDGFDPSKHDVSWARGSGRLNVIDEWLLSKLSSAEAKVRESYAKARYNEACKCLEGLVIGDLSQTYVRLVRSDLWKDDPDERDRRLAVYAVLGHLLERVDVLLHPVSPFVTEYLYQHSLARESAWETPLLAIGFGGFETFESRKSEETVEFALKVEEASNSARTKAKLKRRWPLSGQKVLVAGRLIETAYGAREVVANLCNVRMVDVTSSPKAFPAEFKLVPNRAKVGSLFKERTGRVLANLAELEGTEAVEVYIAANPVKVSLDSGDVEVPINVFELEIAPSAGFEVAERDKIFVAIEKTRDEKLIAEGLVRDVARRLQALRKTRGFSPTAVLTKATVAGLDAEEVKLLAPLSKELAFLVRVKDVAVSEEKGEGPNWAEQDLDGKPIYLDVY